MAGRNRASNESQFPRSQRRRGSSRRKKRAHNGSEQRLSGGLVRGVLCDLLGIEVPVIQAGMSIFTSPALAAAVSNAGALGSLGAWNRPADQLREALAELRDGTEGPFAVNHVVPDLDEEAFAATLEHAPAVVS